VPALCVQEVVKTYRQTVVMSLLQPPPEIFNLFDDLILMSQGYGGGRRGTDYVTASGLARPGWVSIIMSSSLVECRRVVFHGPIGKALSVIESLGFECPARKEVPSFLLEVLTETGEGP